jgi:transcriptional regulator with XRE-family HTH domain
VSEEPYSSPLGQFIRREREMRELSMRKLADLAGISNPYLSQIERGLRDPSDRVLGAIAHNLAVSADTMKQYAHPTLDDDEDEPAVVAAIRADSQLNPRQRQALITVYDSFTSRRRRRPRA